MSSSIVVESYPLSDPKILETGPQGLDSQVQQAGQKFLAAHPCVHIVSHTVLSRYGPSGTASPSLTKIRYDMVQFVGVINEEAT